MSATIVAWEYLTSPNSSINRANSDAARNMLSLVRMDVSHGYPDGKRLRGTSTLSAPPKSRTLVPSPPAGPR